MPLWVMKVMARTIMSKLPDRWLLLPHPVREAVKWLHVFHSFTTRTSLESRPVMPSLRLSLSGTFRSSTRSIWLMRQQLPTSMTLIWLTRFIWKHMAWPLLIITVTSRFIRFWRRCLREYTETVLISPLLIWVSTWPATVLSMMKPVWKHPGRKSSADITSR